MATQSVSPHTGSESLNKLSVTALALAALTLLSMWFLGNSGLAIFAVGAGHVSLNQITRRGGRGRWLAIVALVIGYAVAALSLYSILTAIPLLIQSYMA